jgi:hypothetical protein
MLAATPATSATASAVVANFDVSGCSRVVDVGRGYGAFVPAILSAVPGPYGVLYDLLAVVDKARPALAMAGVAERCDFVGGDFFELVPADGDAYLLSRILHDWDDWDDWLWIRLLANIHQTINSDGRVLEVAVVLPKTVSRPQLAVDQDVMMPEVTGGWKRALKEYEIVFAAPV